MLQSLVLEDLINLILGKNDWFNVLTTVVVNTLNLMVYKKINGLIGKSTRRLKRQLKRLLVVGLVVGITYGLYTLGLFMDIMS